jgi:hypothetical protein
VGGRGERKAALAAALRRSASFCDFGAAQRGQGRASGGQAPDGDQERPERRGLDQVSLGRLDLGCELVRRGVRSPASGSGQVVTLPAAEVDRVRRAIQDAAGPKTASSVRYERAEKGSASSALTGGRPDENRIVMLDAPPIRLVGGKVEPKTTGHLGAGPAAAGADY